MPKLFNSNPPSKMFNKSSPNFKKPLEKLSLPKLFGDFSGSLNQKSVENSSLETSSHSSLSSLVASHLGNSSKFEPSKLFSKTKPVLDKLSNTSAQESPITKLDEWHIDLSNALQAENMSTIDRKKPRFTENKVIFPKHNFEAKNKIKDFDNLCQMDISNKYSYTTVLENKVSKLGKAICCKFRYKRPKVNLCREKIEISFDFIEPSPDDFIINNLRK